jgi:putative Mn2+ efflux pump MntP
VVLVFGGFQAGMPAIGWLLGDQIGSSIGAWDHWIAFTVLTVLGLRMIYNARPTAPEAPLEREIFAPPVVLALAIATSIDALIIGVTLPMLGVSLGPAIATIGLTTGVLCAAGLVIGHYAGARFGRIVEALGGLALVVIGGKILVEHLS